MNAAVDNPYWLPFTANRDFNKNPRVITGAEGHWYTTADGTRLYDTFSGLWTCGIGHCHPKIVEAVQQQVATLDYCMTFQMTNNKALELAERATALAPEGISRCFFTNSGSESVDTALKIALGYHRARGEGNRTRLIGREKGYHGVNFGGMSVGGIVPNRKIFSAALIPGVDHLRHTLDIERNAFSRGLPEHGLELAEDLERLCLLHDGSNIAAVIVEPVAGSAGVIPPPAGYLQRLREICDRHGILLIFDEVITAFGRVGAPFGSQRFVRDEIYDAFMTGPEHMIELFHGYTYSGHPVAAAAGVATLDVYDEEGTFDQALGLEQHFEDLLHSFADHPLVIDVRNFGLMGAVEMAPRDGIPGARGAEAHKKCFWDENVVVRAGMDTLQFSPFLNADPDELTRSFEAVRRVMDTIE
jgi:beta-alanine--pyruvate transaminase